MPISCLDTGTNGGIRRFPYDMSEPTEEELKQQKLEAGLKKYQELKKKKNKKKNKKKSEDVDEEESDLVEKVDALNVHESQESSVEANTAGIDDACAEVEAGDDKATDAVEDKPTDAVEDKPTDAVEDEAANGEAPEKVEEVKEDLPETEHVKEDAEEDTEEAKDVSKDELKEVSKDEPNPADEPSQESNDPVSSLFGDSGPGFMETIQQAKIDDEIAQLKKQNEELKKTNAELSEANAQLKLDNKSLKLLKIDHLDEIETLQAQVQDLTLKLSRAKADASTTAPSHSGYDYQDDNFTLSPSPTYQQPPITSTTFSQFNLDKNESTLSLTELKARLNKWKGWNVDMTSWRSVGSGPIVTL